MSDFKLKESLLLQKIEFLQLEISEYKQRLQVLQQVNSSLIQALKEPSHFLQVIIIQNTTIQELQKTNETLIENTKSVCERFTRYRKEKESFLQKLNSVNLQQAQELKQAKASFSVQKKHYQQKLSEFLEKLKQYQEKDFQIFSLKKQLEDVNQLSQTRNQFKLNFLAPNDRNFRLEARTTRREKALCENCNSYTVYHLHTRLAQQEIVIQNKNKLLKEEGLKLKNLMQQKDRIQVEYNRVLLELKQHELDYSRGDQKSLEIKADIKGLIGKLLAVKKNITKNSKETSRLLPNVSPLKLSVTTLTENPFDLFDIQ